jgi:hypothetical protein
MRIGRSIIIPAILALGVAGSAVAGPGMSVAAAATTSAHVHHMAIPKTSYGYYHN